MAVLAGQQVKQLYETGDADRVALYAIRNVTTADTVDFGADFSVVKRALVLGATATGAGVGSVSSNTVVTVPSGLSADAAWVLVYGCAT